MRVLISGSSGLVGTSLGAELERRGHSVVRLRRGTGVSNAQTAFWDPENSRIDSTTLAGIEAAFHLSGENVASGPWTRPKRNRILSSRVATTSLLARTLADLKVPPRFFFSASAIGYYGSCGDTWVDEDSPKGVGFLSDVCQMWENACAPLRESGIRSVNGRISLVLSTRGGALPMMLLPFRIGLGGRIGSGEQFMSWIALPDLVASMIHCMEQGELRGPVNLASPHPVTNLQFTASLAKAVRRPAIIPVPASLLKATLGDMAKETLLASIRVEPQKLVNTGFLFAQPDLDQALNHILSSKQ